MRTHQYTTELVIDRAAEMAMADGIDSVTYNGLARQLDIRPQSLYRYVSNIKELRILLIRRFMTELVLHLQETLKGLSPADALGTFAMEIFDECHRKPWYYEAINLMHRYDVVEDISETIHDLAGLVQMQMGKLMEDPVLSARYSQLFIAANIGYIHIASLSIFPDMIKDSREAYAQSMNDLIFGVLLHQNRTVQ